jgi:transcription elongation factor Elf1
MKTLDVHNLERSGVHQLAHENKPIKNGIACPTCGEELFDSYPSTTLTSMPPRKAIHCDSCDFKGTRFA